MSSKVRDENYYKVYPRSEIEELSAEEIILVCSPLRFYTKNDENFMFQWIKKVKSITKYYGIGVSLHIIIKSRKISTKDLLEFIGLFRRYNFDIKQLNLLMDEDNKKIFKSLDRI